MILNDNNVSNSIERNIQKKDDKFSLGSFVKNAAIGMGFFVATEAIINVASRGLVAAVAPQLRNLGVNLFRAGQRAQRSGSLGSIIASKLGITVAESAAENARRVVMPSVGELLTGTLERNARAGVYGRAISEFLRHEKSINAQTRGTIDFMTATSQYFAPRNATTSPVSRFLAGTTVRAVRTLMELPAMYAIDRTFGKHYGYDIEKPNSDKLSDQLSSFARYSASAFPGFMLFKTATPLLKGLKRLSIIAGSRIYPSIESRIYDIRNHLRANFIRYDREIAPALRDIYRDIYRHSFDSTGRRSAVGMIRGFVRGAGMTSSIIYRSLNDKNRYNEYIREAQSRDINAIRQRVVESVASAFLPMKHLSMEEQQENVYNYVRSLERLLNRERKYRSTIGSYVYRDSRYTFDLETAIIDEMYRVRGSHRIVNNARESDYHTTLKALWDIMIRDKRKYKFNIDYMTRRNDTFVDLNKIGLRYAASSVAKRIENIAIRIPFSNFSYITGKTEYDLNIPIFKLFGIDYLIDKTEPIGNINFGSKEKTLPWINRETLGSKDQIRRLKNNETGGMVYGVPFVYSINKGKGEFTVAPYHQTYRNIEGTIFERAWKKIKSIPTRIEDRRLEIDESIYVKYLNKKIIQGAKEAKTDFADYLRTNQDILTDFNSRLSIFEYMGLQTELFINRMAASLELGPYGEGSSKLSIITKFFKPNSNYNYFEKYGEIRNTLSLLSSLDDNTARMLKGNPDASARFIAKLQTLHQKSKETTETIFRNIIMKTDHTQLMSSYSGPENELRYINSMKNHINNIVDDKTGIFNQISDETKELIKKTMNILSNTQDIPSLNTRFVDNVYGMRMTELELVQKTILLTKGLQEAYGKVKTNDMTNTITNMMNSRMRFFDSFDSHMPITHNPLTILKNLTELEENANFLKSKNVMYDPTRLDEYLRILLESNIDDATSRVEHVKSKRTAAHYIDSLLQDNQKLKTQMLGAYAAYEDDFALAHRSIRGKFNGLFHTEPHIKYDKYRITKDDILNNGIYVLSYLPKHTPEDIKNQASKHMFSYISNYFLAERLNRVAGSFGINMDQHKSISDSMRAFALKRMVPLVVGLGAWQTADAIFDVLDIAPFQEGLTVGIASNIMQVQNVTSKLRDNIGITDKAKYLEGLMPGFVNSPASRLLRTLTLGFGSAYIGTLMGNPAVGATVGLIANTLQGFGFSDLTNTNEENKDIWSGRKLVPLRAGAHWTLSKSFFFGDRITGWAPHWFARIKSQAEYTNVLYGSKLEALIYKPWPLIGINPLGQILDPYHYERINYANRPYLYTASPGEELPFIGSLASLPLSVLKPVKTMHSANLAEMSDNQDLIVEQNRIAMAAENALLFGNLPDVVTGTDNMNVLAPTSLGGVIDRGLNRTVYQPLGIFGFMSKTALSAFFDNGSPFGTDYVAESAGRMMSTAKEYWSFGFGDQLLTNEFIRRMIPEPEKGFNNIQNTMTWLPGSDYKINFREGDPYTKITLGEFRLPGAGYERLNKVKRTFPISASAAGYDPLTMAMIMANMKQEDDEELKETAEEGKKIHKMYQEILTEQGIAKGTEVFAYDPLSDLYGFIDVVGRNGEVIEIKTVRSISELNQLKNVKYKHKAQLNVYLQAMKSQVGKVIYVARDDPSKTKEFTIARDPRLYLETVKNTATARAFAASIPEEALPPGAGYSHLDRFRILSDVAPFSRQYFQEKMILDEQARLGRLSSEEFLKYYESIKMAEAQMRPTDLYPHRFLGVNPNDSVYALTEINEQAKEMADKVRRGEKLDVDYDIIKKGLDMEYNMYNLNNAIKDAASYNPVERFIGGSYEALMQVQIPYVSRKFMQYWTPMEAYKRNVLQGSKDAFWSSPIESFINPTIDQTLASTNPLQGAIQGGFIGGTMGGMFGGIIGGVVGGIYGASRGILENIGIVKPYIRDDIIHLRQIERTFDDMIAKSAKAEYDRTGNIEALKDYQKTLEGSRNAPNKFFGVFAGLPQAERSYVSLITQTQNEKMINELVRFLPEENTIRMEQYLSDQSGIESSNMYMKQYKNTYSGPVIDWHIINDDITVDKLKYRVIKESGYNSRISGLGWKDQLIKFRSTNAISDFRNPLFKNSSSIDSSDMIYRDIIYKTLRDVGCVGVVNVSNDGIDEITVEIV